MEGIIKIKENKVYVEYMTYILNPIKGLNIYDGVLKQMEVHSNDQTVLNENQPVIFLVIPSFTNEVKTNYANIIR